MVTQSVALTEAPTVPPGNVLEMQIIGPHLDLLKENLHFNKFLRWFICTLSWKSTALEGI